MIRFKFTACMVLSILVHILCAQPQVGLTYGGEKVDRGIFIKNTFDHHVLIIGLTESFSESQDVYVLKIDLQGKKIWERNFGGVQYDAGWSFEEVNDGYLIAGFSKSFGADEDILLIKVHNDGELVWMKNLPRDGNERCWSIKKISDGNFILTGQTQNRITKNYDALITKINADGDVLWQKQYGDERYERLFYSTETSGKDIMLAGIVRKDSTAENMGMMMLLGSDGTKKMVTYLDTWRNTTLHGVLPVSHKQILLYGYAQTDTARLQRTIYMAMFDGKGSLKWERVTADRGKINHALSAVLTSDGSILISGYIKALTPGSLWNGYVSAFSKKGKQRFLKDFGGHDADQPYTITPISKSQFFITGHTYSNGAGQADIWLVKVDEKGNVINLDKK